MAGRSVPLVLTLMRHMPGSASLQFTVGLKLKGKTDHITVDAEDAPIAALKVKTDRRGSANHVRPAAESAG